MQWGYQPIIPIHTSHDCSDWAKKAVTKITPQLNRKFWLQCATILRQLLIPCLQLQSFRYENLWVFSHILSSGRTSTGFLTSPDKSIKCKVHVITSSLTEHTETFAFQWISFCVRQKHSAQKYWNNSLKTARQSCGYALIVPKLQFVPKQLKLVKEMTNAQYNQQYTWKLC
jgi:hypothetical protein